MLLCEACGKVIDSRHVYCKFCGVIQQAVLPAVRFLGWKTAFTFVGVFVAAFLGVGLCLVPVFVLFPLVALIIPVYVVAGGGGALSIALKALHTCRASGGRIPVSAFTGFGFLVLAIVVAIDLRVNQQHVERQSLEAVKQQFGPLFYPDALPDPYFPVTIRAKASLSDVLRFYKENRACDGRKYFGGGGEYTLSCMPGTSAVSRVWIKLSSRVENNEPYVMISMVRNN